MTTNMNMNDQYNTPATDGDANADMMSDPAVYAGDAEIGDIYNLPGEGFVVELHHAGTTHLFDKQGLQHRIWDKKRLGLDAAVEEAALLRINNFTPTFEAL